MAQNASESGSDSDVVFLTGGVPIPRASQASVSSCTEHQSPSAVGGLAAVASKGQRDTRHGSVAGSRSGEPRNKGPPVIAAIVGVPDGRWASEFSANSIPGKSAMFTLRKSWTDAASDVSKFPLPLEISWSHGQSPVLFGFAVLTSWAISEGNGTSHAAVMMALLHHKYRKCKGIEFLEHSVLNCACMDRPVPVNVDELVSESTRDKYNDIVQNAKFVVGKPGASGKSLVNAFPDLMERWAAEYTCATKVYKWPFWWPLAQLVLTGHWPLDVTAIVPRMSKKVWMPPVLPPRAQLRDIKNSRTFRVVDHEESLATEYAMPRPAGGSGATSSTRFTPDHHIRAVMASQHLKANMHAGQAAQDNLTLMFPDRPELQKELDAKGFAVPKKDALRTSRPRFDIAAMIANRELYRRTGPFFRYIASDASPQNSESIELFSSVERTVKRADIKGKDFAGVKAEDIRHRLMPLSTLGQGRTDLASKVIAQAPFPCLSVGCRMVVG